MTSKERLQELIDRMAPADARSDVDVEQFFKWRVQAQWLLCQKLGRDHCYTVQFDSILGRDLDLYPNGRQIVAGRGLLKGLLEDWEHGHIELEPEPGQQAETCG